MSIEHETLSKADKKIRRKEKRKKRRKFMRRIFLVIFLLFLIACGFMIHKLLPVYQDLKTQEYQILSTMSEDTFIRAGNTEIYDAAGNLIGRVGNEHYEYISVDNVPYVTNGYIAQEDKEFPYHNGINLKRIVKAGITLIKKNGEITQGGSTITQQVVKNNLLSQEKTFKRKALEILLALDLEKRYDKAQIMEAYCNSCYYGNGCYGIEGASEYYFGKRAEEMSLAEAATLVGTSNSPNNYNPVINYKLSMQKKESVLKNMLNENYITQDEYDSAMAEEPKIVQKTTNVESNSYLFSYALHCTVLELMAQEDFKSLYTFDSSEEYEAYEKQYDEKYSEVYEAVREGGYKIYTSLNSEMQNKLQSYLSDGLKDFTNQGEDGLYEMQGGAVCIDNETQLVVAIVGGREDNNAFNRGYQSKRQPGSAIKPILDYGPAMNEGVTTPQEVLNDEPLNINGWEPKNASGSFSGPVSVRDALAKSINTIAVQLYLKADQGLTYLDKLHFSSLSYADETADSVSIGGFTNGVTVADMARGYATIANGGKYSTNTCLTKIVDKIGKTIYELPDDKSKTEEEVYLADTAFLLTDMMEGVFQQEYGTAHEYVNDNQVYAGKTGTTNNNKDAWFCGFSAYYTTVVWTGYDTPQSVDGLYGNTYPAQIWSNFMNDIHNNLAKEEFTVPNTIKLTNGTDKTNVDYSDNIYWSRPDGWDYCSDQLEEKYEKHQKAEAEKKNTAAAESAVSEFESYMIQSTDEARNLDARYQDVLNKIELVNDANKKTSLYDRAARKYETFTTEIKDSWQKAIEQEAAEQENLKNEQEVVDAQASYEKSLEIYNTSKVRLADWYINQLGQRTVYGEYTQKLLSDGESAVEACNGLEDYENLRKQMDAVKRRVTSLPTKEDILKKNTTGGLPSEESYPSDDPS